MSITKQEAIEREARMFGGDLDVIDWIELEAGAAVLTYTARSQGVNPDQVMVSTRYTVCTPDGGGSGGIISTRWEDSP